MVPRTLVQEEVQMPNTFFIADNHFGHKNVIEFEKEDGELLRNFLTLDDMHEHMIEKWNNVVKLHDTVYVLGDVVINRKAFPLLHKLSGRKILVKGNHDIFPIMDYLEYFDDVRAYKVLTADGIICSHIPIHPDSLERWKFNVHGHLHNNSVNDKRYFCVSAEQLNYTPIALDELRVRLNEVT